MSTSFADQVLYDISPTKGLDHLRQAGWLKCAYSDPVWFVTDNDSDSDVVRINFRYRLADGRCLTEVERLYATVKEFAWFLRDARFSRIEDAWGQRGCVYAQLAIAHALTLRGIESYSHLQRGDVEALVQDLRLGTDGVLHASERLAAHINKIENDPEARCRRYKGFPVARSAKGFSKNVLDTSQLLAECNLPKSASYVPRVNWLVATAALRNGMSSYSRARGAKMPPFRNVTKQHLQRSLDALDLLFAVRHYAQCEVPTFRPFPNGTVKTANRFGVDTIPTRVPPPALILHLLESSAKWVGTYSQPIISCLEELESAEALTEHEVEAALHRCSKGLPREIVKKLENGVSPNHFLRTAVEMLVTASWILIAAFSARRYGETIDLEQASLRGNDEEGWWLDCFISKTTKKRELIPVPLVTARAFEILRSISASARADGSTDMYRWQPPAAFTGERPAPKAVSPRKLLNAFAHFVDTPLPDDDREPSAWHWIPRQFRRFFAVLYFYRFEGADLVVLSYFLRHFDLETTRGYVTRDAETARIWRDVEKDYVRRLANSIAADKREVSGAMGERLKKLAKLIKGRLEKRLFVSSEAVGETLHQIMERGGLVITPKAWVTCTCPRTHNAAKKARCRAQQMIDHEVVGPSFADAGPTVCTECRWALMEPTKLGYATDTQTQLETSLNSDNGRGTLFRDLERAQLVGLRRITNTPAVRLSVGTSGDHHASGH
jgi:hypothetical protein